MANLEPGWLMRTVHEAHMLCMCNHSPAFMSHISPQKTPIPEDEARELYEMMNERFKQWTGKELADLTPQST